MVCREDRHGQKQSFDGRAPTPGDLEKRLAAFVIHYNHDRYRESLDNLTPADIYFGRGPDILEERNRIIRQTIANRGLQHQLQAE